MRQRCRRRPARVHTFITRRNGITLVIPAHAQRRMRARGGRLGDILRHMSHVAQQDERGPVAIVSTLDIMPIVYLQPGQAVLKTVLRRGEALKPGTRIVEVYL
jgi:hypothetical protein